MKFLIVLAFVGCACADVAHLDAAAEIVNEVYESEPEGNYRASFETSNGIYSQASGVVKNANTDSATLEVSGSIKYTSPDGTPVELSYVANENGYQPQGSHLPVPPPIPEAIARSLEYIAAHPPPVEPAARLRRNVRLPADKIVALTG